MGKNPSDTIVYVVWRIPTLKAGFGVVLDMGCPEMYGLFSDEDKAKVCIHTELENSDLSRYEIHEFIVDHRWIHQPVKYWKGNT